MESAPGLLFNDVVCSLSSFFSQVFLIFDILLTNDFLNIFANAKKISQHASTNFRELKRESL